MRYGASLRDRQGLVAAAVGENCIEKRSQLGKDRHLKLVGLVGNGWSDHLSSQSVRLYSIESEHMDLRLSLYRQSKSGEGRDVTKEIIGRKIRVPRGDRDVGVDVDRCRL
jgi:hypothetical protein